MRSTRRWRCHRLLGPHRPQHPAAAGAGAGTTRPIDPWGGSYYVEWLTYQLAQRPRPYRGGRGARGHGQAIERRHPKLRIEEAAARTQARIDSGQQPVIGVNKLSGRRGPGLEVLKVENSRVRAEQLAKLKQLRAERDEAAVTAALDELAPRPPRRPRRRGRPGQQPVGAGDRRRPGQRHRR